MQRIQKTISEFVPDAPVSTLAPDDTVATALAHMKEQSSDAVLVVEQGALIGIFTDRDFLNRIAAEERPATTPLREVMTGEPESLKGHHCVSYAINRMVVRGFRHIPILDDSGAPVALLSVHDVIGHISKVFDELNENARSPEFDEWVDIGGGA